MESRRSNVNLSYLTLAPLSSRLPLEDEDGGDVQVPTPWTQRTSYIAGKSAPTTPGILSQSPSQTRLGATTSTKLASSKSYTHLHAEDPIALSKSKSTTMIAQQRGAASPLAKKKKVRSSMRLHTGTDDGAWLYRAGTAISSETRESKGQSWLVSRESSTSLVAADQDAPYSSIAGMEPNAGDGAGYGARMSRNSSRLTSARTSRRGSRTGSRPDLTYLASPELSRSPGVSRNLLDRKEETGDYFGQLQDSSTVIGPDFVDAEEDDDEDSDDEEELRREEEEEVARLANDRGSGLGSMVDRLLGWTLFDVREDPQESEDEDFNGGETPQPLKRDKARSTEQSHIIKGPSGATSQSKTAEGEDAQGGWADAAWLLSVASKVIL